MTPSTTSGVVRSMSDRGFAFVTNQDGDSVFVHRSAIVGSLWEALRVGDSVTFEQTDTPKGWRGEQLRVTSSATASVNE